MLITVQINLKLDHNC